MKCHSFLLFLFFTFLLTLSVSAAEWISEVFTSDWSDFYECEYAETLFIFQNNVTEEDFREYLDY
ncbi:MAG: hypothetical protein Q4C70_11425 [Planctomycetia bacterium]|nr:hypothetical protein [Planctomycetia bacterium]